MAQLSERTRQRIGNALVSVWWFNLGFCVGLLVAHIQHGWVG